jgi:hypothetical protein
MQVAWPENVNEPPPPRVGGAGIGVKDVVVAFKVQT